MNTICHTYSGTFDPFNPRAEDVCLEDIAHHLAMICRYGGATPVYYSVAEHAVHVCRLVERVSGDARLALLALHHDSAEAYVHDIRSPLKHRMLFMSGGPMNAPCSFELVELGVLMSIYKGLNLPDFEGDDCNDDRKLIKAADDTMLRIELREFFGTDRGLGDLEKIFHERDRPSLNQDQTWSWQAAKDKFYSTHRRLVRTISKQERAT